MMFFAFGKKEFFGFIYDDWWAFKDFLDWALDNGYAEGMHLLRYDDKKPYTSDNCVFSAHLKFDTSSLYYYYKARGYKRKNR